MGLSKRLASGGASAGLAIMLAILPSFGIAPPLWSRILVFVLAATLFVYAISPRKVGRIKVTPALTLGAVCALGLAISIVWQLGFGGGAAAAPTESSKGSQSQPHSVSASSGGVAIGGDNRGTVIGTQNVYVTSKGIQSPTQHQVSSWYWKELPLSKIEALAERFKKLSAPKSIIIGSVTYAGKDLAENLSSAAVDAKWDQAAFRDVFRRVDAQGITITGEDAEVFPVKAAIEKVTGLHVDIVKSQFSPGQQPLTILVGAKPILDPVPVDMKEKAEALGGQMSTLATEISQFSADRAALKLSEGIRAVASDEKNWARERWAQGVDFSTQTQAEYQRRYGARSNGLIVEAEVLGIIPASSLRIDPSPSVMGSWFGTVGKLLSAGQIREARATASDETFWFGQR